MKQILQLVFAILVANSVVFPQSNQNSSQLKIVEFKMDIQGTNATEFYRTDADGKLCVLIKVKTEIDNLVFYPTQYIIGDVEKKQDEYWVYFSTATKSITISTPKYSDIEYKFHRLLLPGTEYYMLLELESGNNIDDDTEKARYYSGPLLHFGSSLRSNSTFYSQQAKIFFGGIGFFEDEDYNISFEFNGFSTSEIMIQDYYEKNDIHVKQFDTVSIFYKSDGGYFSLGWHPAIQCISKNKAVSLNLLLNINVGSEYVNSYFSTKTSMVHEIDDTVNITTAITDSEYMLNSEGRELNGDGGSLFISLDLGLSVKIYRFMIYLAATRRLVDKIYYPEDYIKFGNGTGIPDPDAKEFNPGGNGIFLSTGIKIILGNNK